VTLAADIETALATGSSRRNKGRWEKQELIKRWSEKTAGSAASFLFTGSAVCTT